MVKLVAAFHLAALCLNAGLIVSGTAPGMLAQASLAIPTDPNMQPIPTMRDSASGFWSGTVTVLGGSGSGFLYFNMMAFGESFGGSPSSEYMDSYAGYYLNRGFGSLTALAASGKHAGVVPILRPQFHLRSASAAGIQGLRLCLVHVLPDAAQCASALSRIRHWRFGVDGTGLDSGG